MESCAITASITAIANTIACKLDDDQLNLLAAILVQLGDTLVTISQTRSICENKNDSA